MRIIEDPKLLSAPDLCECGFVPTMGALHAGHGALVERARADGRPVVVSIFVNPTQFGPREDYARYPRTLDADCALLEPLGAAAVFVPSVEAIYPRGLEAARAEAEALALPDVATRPGLEDASRPHHFGGVALVVGRLFDLVRPARAYFGEKDYQQLRLIEDMVAADRGRYGTLEVVPCPTIRERNGLAMSSRNRYLAPDERDAALALSRALQIAHSEHRVQEAHRPSSAASHSGQAGRHRRSPGPGPDSRAVIIRTKTLVGGTHRILALVNPSALSDRLPRPCDRHRGGTGGARFPRHPHRGGGGDAGGRRQWPGDRAQRRQHRRP
jgi:pantoate--beta-alanine ligase